jgi:hypothetical protein
VSTLGAPGYGGSGGATGGTTIGGAYGGGGSAKQASSSYAVGESGGVGAVRIIWGVGRAYPATNTGDV